VTVGRWRPGDPPGTLTLGFVREALGLEPLGLSPEWVLGRLATLVTSPGARPPAPGTDPSLPAGAPGNPSWRVLEEASDEAFPALVQGARALRALASGDPDWLDGLLARTLARLASGLPHRTFEVVRRNQFSPVTGTVLRRWLLALEPSLPSSWRSSLPGIVEPLEALFWEGEQPAFPYDVGRRRYFGRVLLEEPEVLRPLGARRQSALEVRLFWSQGRPRARLEGVRPLPLAGSAGAPRLARAVEALGRALGDRLPAPWVTRALALLGASLKRRGHPLADHWPALAEVAGVSPARRSAVETFERASFHRGRNDFLYHSAALGEALERLDLVTLGWPDGPDLLQRLALARSFRALPEDSPVAGPCPVRK